MIFFQTKESVYQNFVLLCLKKAVYENCKMLAPDGVVLSNTDKKKAYWYVERNLATIEFEEPLTIRLNFQPSNRYRNRGTGEEDKDDENPDEDEDEGLSNPSSFCFAYYLSRYLWYNLSVEKHREIRIAIIKEVFRDLTGKWDRNFVIFPISSFEDIQLMM